MSRPADPLTGVKCFSIGGRMVDTRQRCLGMTDEERRWRAQWLKDQILSPDEPREVPEYYKATNHFIRRLWRTPMNKFQKALEPLIGEKGAFRVRYSIGKAVPMLFILYASVYYAKYHTNNFEFAKNVEIVRYQIPMLPDHPDYPNVPVKKPSDYYDMGFYSSVLCQEVHYVPPPPSAPPPPPPPPLVDEEGEVIVCIPSEVAEET